MALRPELGDRFIDPWRRSQGQPLDDLLAFITHRLDAHERETGRRIRARKPQDQARRAELIEVVGCGITEAVIHPPGTGRIVVPLGYRNRPKRYRYPALAECLPDLLQSLHETGLASVSKGRRQGEATTISPSPEFAKLLCEFGVTDRDLGRSHSRGDPIVLTRTLKSKTGRKRKRWIDYQDTFETERMRGEMDRINAFLQASPVSYQGREGEDYIDPSDLWLSRRFIVLEGQEPRFDQSGRLFGGFHQNLAKTLRKNIRVAGEPVVALDFNAAFTRIAMAEAGYQPGEGDIYTIPGLESLPRPERKAAFNVFLFAKPGITRWPSAFEGLDDETGEIVSRFPTGWPPQAVRRLILQTYPCLAEPYRTEGGYRMMWKESEIMVRLLLEMIDLQLVGLPIHDAVLVPRSKATEIKTMMMDISRVVTGQAIPVAVEPY